MTEAVIFDGILRSFPKTDLPTNYWKGIECVKDLYFCHRNSRRRIQEVRKLRQGWKTALNFKTFIELGWFDLINFQCFRLRVGIIGVNFIYMHLTFGRRLTFQKRPKWRSDWSRMQFIARTTGNDVFVSTLDVIGWIYIVVGLTGSKIPRNLNSFDETTMPVSTWNEHA